MINLPDNIFQKCSNCMVKDKVCEPQSGSRTNLFCCVQCTKMKSGCNQEQLHMYQKFQVDWVEISRYHIQNYRVNGTVVLTGEWKEGETVSFRGGVSCQGG